MGIPENIKSLRERANMTQKKLAEKSGLSIASIQGYEQGKFEPKKEALYKLVKALECNIYEITDSPYDLPDLLSENLEDLGNGIMVTSNCPPDIRDKIKASFLDDYDVSKGVPRFTAPMSNERKKESDKLRRNSGAINEEYLDDLKFNDMIQKKKRGGQLTAEEQSFYDTYLERGLRQALETAIKFYFMLNDNGKKKADAQITQFIEQLELLTKVPEYQRDTDSTDK